LKYKIISVDSFIILLLNNMDIKQLFSSLTSLIPFWSNSVIGFIGLGPEYTVTLNLVFGSLISHVEQLITEEIAIGTIVFVVITAICYKNNLLTYIPNIFPRKKFVGYTIYTDDNSSSSFKIINALTSKIMNSPEYNFQRCIYGENFGTNCLLGHAEDVRLDNDLFLTVKRGSLTDTVHFVTYILSSYRCDLDKFVDACVNEHTYDSNVVFFNGEENDTEFNYSDIMKYVTCYLYNEYRLPCVINKKCVNKTQNDIDSTTTSTIDALNRRTFDNPFYNYDNKKLLLLDNCKNMILGDEIILSVTRFKTYTTYKIIVNNDTVENFITKAKACYYNKVCENEKTSALTFIDTIRCGPNGGLRLFQDLKITAMILYLIKEKSYSSYSSEMLEITERTRTHYTTKLLEQIYLNMCYEYKFDDLVLTVEKGAKTKDCDEVAKYTLSSNTVDVGEKMNSFVKWAKEQKKIDTGLYHFILCGFTKDHQPLFIKQLIHGNDKECFQTFDHIYTEHNESLMHDIDQLKNTEYYKTMGLKPKKSYLFYGNSGCGKTATVLAMAIYGKRHIVEFSLSKITSNMQLDNLMNISEICGIPVKNENLILMADEIDTTLNGIRTNESNIVADAEPNGIEKMLMMMHSDKDDDTKANNVDDNSKLTLGNILSRFDGIYDYDKLIIVALTNCIERLDPALYRDMRLSKRQFLPCSVDNCCKIIIKFFKREIDDDEMVIINDLFETYEIIPAKIVCFCDMYVDTNIKTMLSKMKESIIIDAQNENRIKNKTSESDSIQ
jgi:ATP-dependent 26S proteasome regulatory subunit